MRGQEERERQKGGCGMAVLKTSTPAQKTNQQGGCLAAAVLTRRLTVCCKIVSRDGYERLVLARRVGHEAPLHGDMMRCRP